MGTWSAGTQVHMSKGVEQTQRPRPHWTESAEQQQVPGDEACQAGRSDHRSGSGLVRITRVRDRPIITGPVRLISALKALQLGIAVSV